MLCLSLFGPQPLAWLWIGSQVDYLTGYVTAGIAHGDARLPRVADDHDGGAPSGSTTPGSWSAARPATARSGARWSASSRPASASRPWCSRSGSSIIQGPGPTFAPQQLSVGFRDYYRQYDDLDERELNRERRARREREKRLALERLPDLDLSGTEWPDLPHSEVVNAAIARARGLVNRYPDRYAAPVRRLLAERHGIAPEQIALGNGAAELLQAAALALLGRGDELVMPWPSYPLYPLLAAHAGARPVFAEHGRAERRGHRPHPGAGRLQSQRPDRRLHALARARARCSPGCPPTCTCCSTRRSSTSRTRRTSTPACAWWTRSRGCWSCAPSRRSTACPGCAPATRSAPTSTCSPPSRPVLGVNALTQAAVEHALRTGDAEIDRRRRAVSRERLRVTEGLTGLGADVTRSQANFVWVRAPGLSGDALAQALRRQGVIVAPGGPLGADDHVRAAVLNEGATDRLCAPTATRQRVTERFRAARGRPRSELGHSRVRRGRPSAVRALGGLHRRQRRPGGGWPAARDAGGPERAGDRDRVRQRAQLPPLSRTRSPSWSPSSPRLTCAPRRSRRRASRARRSGWSTRSPTACPSRTALSTRRWRCWCCARSRARRRRSRSCTAWCAPAASCASTST